MKTLTLWGDKTSMDIQRIKLLMKENKITYEMLSKESKIPLNTLKNIFRGKTVNPRIDTVEAIEKALGLNQEPRVTSEQSELIELINSMNEEELAELTQIVEYVISKRK